MRPGNLSLSRTVSLVIALAGMLFSGLGHALGLGEITLKSNLNEPLNAEIRLLKVRDLSKEQIFVELASRADFSRASVERIFFLNELRFEVFIDNPSYPYIRVTSGKPVSEPYLNFLIDVQWPTGRLVREYTLLLDLPVFANDTSEPSVSLPGADPVAQPRAVDSGSQPSSVVQETVVEQTRGDVVRNPARAERVVPDTPPGSYRVKNGDTLWEIAEQFRPNANLSVSQTMLAIQRANPEAFSGDNINRLQSGRVLRLPDAAEISELSRQQAIAEVNRQTRVWRGEEPAFADQGAALTGTAPVSADSNANQALEGRLSLGSADSGESRVRGSGATGSGEALQNELAIANEELDRKTRENSELQARISELEAQISTMQELIDVSSEQLRALELSLGDDQQTEEAGDANVSAANQGQVADTDEGVVAGDSTLVDSDASPGEAQTASDEPATSPLPEASAVVEATPVEAPPAETATDAAPASIVTKVMNIVQQNLQLVLGGLAALLLLLLLLFRLGRSKQDNDEEYEFEDEHFDEQGDEEFAEPLFDEEEAVGFDEENEESIEAETEDVVAEADIYISLGQTEKAIELLQKEVQQNPDNSEARLGMLKVFAAEQNVDAFDDQYAQLLPLGDDAAIQQARALREQIGGVAPFDTENYSLGDIDHSSMDIDEEDLISELNTYAAEEEVASPDATADTQPLDEDFETTLESLDSADSLDDFDRLEESESFEESDSPENSSGLEELEAIAIDNADESLDEFGELDFDLDLDLDADLDSDLDSDLDLDLELDADQEFEQPGQDADPGQESDDNLETELEELSAALPEAGLEGEDLFDLEDALDNEDNEAGANVPDLSTELESPVAAEEHPADEWDIESDLEAGLDLDPADNSGFDLEEGLPEDLDSLDIDLDNDLELEEGEEGLGLDLDSVEQPDSLAVDELTGADGSEDIDALSFEQPPANFDMEDLDRELDEMTSDFDEPPVVEADDPTEHSAEGLVETEAPQSVSTSDEDENVALDEDTDDSLLDGSDEVATKLELARAYMDMGDTNGASDILQEVLEEGSQSQKDKAKSLLDQI